MADVKGEEAKGEGAKGEHLNIKVKDQNGNEVFFRMRQGAPLKKLMTTYCERQGVSESQMVFLYDGTRLTPEMTPASLEMEEVDQVDAVIGGKQGAGRAGEEAEEGGKVCAWE